MLRVVTSHHMILDQLTHSALYESLSPGLALGLRFLSSTNLGALEGGRHSIDGDAVFALVSDYETKTPEAGAWEAHRQHVDIQCVVSGEERIGCADLSAMQCGPYDESNDVLFAEGDGDVLTLTPGRFAIFFPHDVHMPGLTLGGAPARVKKIVVKVRIAPATSLAPAR